MTCTTLTAAAQDKHNFAMSPEKTDCHSLTMTEDSLYNIAQIRKSSFRFKEEIKISKYHTPNSVEYYSCDGENGYLIAVESDTNSILYLNISKTKYDSLSNSDDPVTFYNQYFKPRKLINSNE